MCRVPYTVYEVADSLFGRLNMLADLSSVVKYID